MTATISVITPCLPGTREITRAIGSVQRQTRSALEHWIVYDGLRTQADHDAILRAPCGVVQVEELGRNWTHRHTPSNRGSIARLVGTYLARGDYIAYLDADDAYCEDHLERLAQALDSGLDLAYSRACVINGKNERSYVGQSVPERGKIVCATMIHRWQLCQQQNWQPHTDPDDFALMLDWLNMGATWAYVDCCTYLYYDKKGG